MTFSLNISCLCLFGSFTLFMLNILNGLIKMPTDCSVDLIFIRLAAQLYFFELKNIYEVKYFYLDSNKLIVLFLKI